jgi:cytochrome c553
MRRGVLVAAMLFAVTPLFAYPEFQAWAQKNSGRAIDCSMCHVNSDGPEGVKPGQIRGLNPKELERLNQARAAFEPGSKIDNPILNAFGDHIIQTIGKKKFLEIRSTGPGQLVSALGMKSDLDGDGIPDAREYADGTLPTDSLSGDPLELFTNNFRRSWLDILMTFMATLLGLYGLNQLLRWFEQEAEPEPEPEKEVELPLPYLARRATSSRRWGKTS